MSSKSALKKLKKKTKKVAGKSLKQLNALTANTSKVTRLTPQLKQELNQLSGQVIGNVVSELIHPLNPIISWFNDVDQTSFVTPKSAAPLSIPPAQRIAPSTVTHQAERTRSISVLQIPLKSPACKRCPALAGGHCKCAAKKFNISL